jgi:hypothetical protein
VQEAVAVNADTPRTGGAAAAKPAANAATPNPFKLKK